MIETTAWSDQNAHRTTISAIPFCSSRPCYPGPCCPQWEKPNQQPQLLRRDLWRWIIVDEEWPPGSLHIRSNTWGWDCGRKLAPERYRLSWDDGQRYQGMMSESPKGQSKEAKRVDLPNKTVVYSLSFSWKITMLIGVARDTFRYPISLAANGVPGPTPGSWNSCDQLLTDRSRRSSVVFNP